MFNIPVHIIVLMTSKINYDIIIFWKKHIGGLLMRKIILIGWGGSGKSTFSRKLSNKLNIKVFHLDALMWKPNWEVTDKNYQIQIQKETKVI